MPRSTPESDEMESSSWGRFLPAVSLSRHPPRGTVGVTGPAIRTTAGSPSTGMTSAGILQRGQPRDTSRKDLTIGRAGVRSQWEIGGSGFAVSLNAGVHLANTPESGSSAVRYRGHDGEALLLYKTPRKLPLFAAIGWRLQTTDDLSESPKEVFTQSGPVFAIGLRLGH